MVAEEMLIGGTSARCDRNAAPDANGIKGSLRVRQRALHAEHESLASRLTRRYRSRSIADEEFA